MVPQDSVKHIFETFNYAVDVTFQQANSPYANNQERNHYYSGIHHLYCIKVEVFVRPNRLPLDVNKHSGGSVSHMFIMQERSAVHRQRCTKREDGLNHENEC